MPNPILKTRNVSLVEKYTCFILQRNYSVIEEIDNPRRKSKSFFAPKFLLGFSELQILQTLEHCHKIFSYSDIYNHVEIWDEKHALQIYKILNDVFGDLDEYTFTPEENKDDR